MAVGNGQNRRPGTGSSGDQHRGARRVVFLIGAVLMVIAALACLRPRGIDTRGFGGGAPAAEAVRVSAAEPGRASV